MPIYVYPYFQIDDILSSFLFNGDYSKNLIELSHKYPPRLEGKYIERIRGIKKEIAELCFYLTCPSRRKSPPIFLTELISMKGVSFKKSTPFPSTHVRAPLPPIIRGARKRKILSTLLFSKKDPITSPPPSTKRFIISSSPSLTVT